MMATKKTEETQREVVTNLSREREREVKSTMDEANLASRLSNPSRPVFLLGDVPPGEGTPPGKCQTICNKFMARSRALASDGFIVYDIQDEPGRSDMERPFPFRRVMDSSGYAALLARSSGKECVVYKCVADPKFDEWLERASTEHGHTAINLVGRASSKGEYQGPTISEAMEKVQAQKLVKFGCVCIAERHTIEAAKARGKTYPTEHQNMIRKQNEGAEWFISQAIYDPEPTIRLLKDYAAVCREQGITPKKVILTFTPVSREKTMNFIKWLGVKVPLEAEQKILGAEKPVDASVGLLCNLLRTILAECVGVGVPLGISCESVSIYKAEIDGVHELFKKLQEILLDARGSPWKVQWVEIMPPLGNFGKRDYDNKKNQVARSGHQIDYALAASGMVGAVVGGILVGMGVVLGGVRKTK
jgi:5,10-methylenetetrahydrofolate reductase